MSVTSKFGVPLDVTEGQNVTIQPKLKFKFRVRFLGLGSLSSATFSFDAMQQVMTVKRPTINFDAKEIGTYSGTVSVINKPKYDPIQITFKDDVRNSMMQAVMSQIAKQYDFIEGRYAVSGGSYKFSMIIETLDGNNVMRAIDSFRLDNCTITSVDTGQLGYGESGVVETSVTIKFDNIGSYLSEINGIENPYYLLWYATANPTVYATNPTGQ